jgi:tetratricopeptide (TPR) repeat protein
MASNGKSWLCGSTRAVLLAGIAVLFSACASSREVYIPQEYRSPAPQQGQGYGGSQQQSRTAAPQPQTAPQGPVLNRSSDFKKQDISPAAEPAAPPPAAKKPAPERPQHLASMQLVDQAKASLSKGKPDAAIPVLERAIQADVYNGEAFLALARAWKQKGSRQKAFEFAKKAEILFQEEPAGLQETLLFQADLYREMGDNAKAGEYRQRASSLK